MKIDKYNRKKKPCTSILFLTSILIAGFLFLVSYTGIVAHRLSDAATDIRNHRLLQNNELGIVARANDIGKVAREVREYLECDNPLQSEFKSEKSGVALFCEVAFSVSTAIQSNYKSSDGIKLLGQPEFESEKPRKIKSATDVGEVAREVREYLECDKLFQPEFKSVMRGRTLFCEVAYSVSKIAQSSNNVNHAKLLQPEFKLEKLDAATDGDKVLQPEFNSEKTEKIDAATDIEKVSKEIREYLECDKLLQPGSKSKVSGATLFCEVAFSKSETVQSANKNANGIQCPLLNTQDDRFFDFWNVARSKMPKELLLKTLLLARETKISLRGYNLLVWSPTGDIGLPTVVQEMNQDDYDVTKLGGHLGPEKVFVDAGSNLGLVSMIIALEYPGTSVVSIEAASPTWLYQNLNILCNFDEEKKGIIHSIHAGLGDKDDTTMTMMWRPKTLTSTRAWSPQKENAEGDFEIIVPIRTIQSIMIDLDMPFSVNVFKLDCEGCEYNVVPSLSNEEFESIGTFIGEIHWGFIPNNKKPSSNRGAATHQRLCQYSNFARVAKECCAFPSLRVKNTEKNINGIAGSLCSGFNNWAKEKKLFSIPDDTGWLSESSTA